VQPLYVAPLVVPYVILATGLFQVFLRLGLRGTVASIIIAHAVISIPYVVLLVGGALHHVERSLEEAASTLGANALLTFYKVTLPLIGPGLLAAAVFTFIVSFDDFIIAYFLAGPTTVTLPIRVFASLQERVDPVIAPVATIMLTLTLSAVLIYDRATRRLEGTQ
jgi:ABC-type spermidine/putrescine transport system permease subunit II